jgi:uncharacterized membrane protein YsdA (DUF1294 family)
MTKQLFRQDISSDIAQMGLCDAKYRTMPKKVMLILAAVVGGLVGAIGTRVFRHVLDVDVRYLSQNPWLVGTFGLIMFALIANAACQAKADHPRFYGLFVLGIGSAVFLQSIFSLPESCTESCQTNFQVNLGVCLILMVEGFGSFSRSSAKRQ